MKVGVIYYVGRNFRMDAVDLGNGVPNEPMIFKLIHGSWKEMMARES